MEKLIDVAAVGSMPWLDSDCITAAAASSDAVASQRRQGCDDSSPAPYYEDSLVTLYHGNSLEIMPRLPSGGTVVTDPPYNVGYHYEGYADNLSSDDYAKLLLATCRPPCVVLHYAEDLVELSMLIGAKPEKMVAWVYPSNTMRQWRAVAWWGSKPDFSLERQDYRNPKDKRIAERMANGERARLYDWWEIDQVKNVGADKTEHPCQIPEAVMSKVIRITPCAFIVDPFCGSGTTLRAAKDAGVRAIGIETSERYCEIAAKRMAQEVLNFTPSVAAHPATLTDEERGSRNTTAQESNVRVSHGEGEA